MAAFQAASNEARAPRARTFLVTKGGGLEGRTKSKMTGALPPSPPAPRRGGRGREGAPSASPGPCQEGGSLRQASSRKSEPTGLWPAGPRDFLLDPWLRFGP